MSPVSVLFGDLSWLRICGDHLLSLLLAAFVGFLFRCRRRMRMIKRRYLVICLDLSLFVGFVIGLQYSILFCVFLIICLESLWPIPVRVVIGVIVMLPLTFCGGMWPVFHVGAGGL